MGRPRKQETVTYRCPKCSEETEVIGEPGWVAHKCKSRYGALVRMEKVGDDV